MLDFKRINIIVGHYGSGKTNTAVNLALEAKRCYPEKNVRVADLDIVNPYFRAADSISLLKENGIELLMPALANTNVDIPSLPPMLISSMADENGILFIDVGGDDGAVALGMYNSYIKQTEYNMLYVVNSFRPLVSHPSDAIDCLREIEEASGLFATHIVNNSSLGEETTADDVISSIEYAEKCGELSSLPVAFHTYPRQYAPNTPSLVKPYIKEFLLPVDDIAKKLF